MSIALESIDTAELRKARGAFFTPDPITKFITAWAISEATDRVLEPSAGDAAFLVQVVARLRELGAETPTVAGVEIHASSVAVAEERVREAGGIPAIVHGDFFAVDVESSYDAVVGNPPYIRYQDFSGESRLLARQAALAGGVALTGLASSWAAFTVQSARFLRAGGRLGLVLPAELLSVNYAAPVRQFLFDHFSSVELVLFAEQVFPEAEADVVLLLASGYGQGAAGHATIYQVDDAAALSELGPPVHWSPTTPSDRWTGLLVSPDAIEPLRTLRQLGHFESLEQWGDTTLGMVTGNNAYFTLSPRRVEELGLARTDLLRISPPGSSHLRGLALSRHMLTRLGKKGRATYLFRPAGEKLTAPAAAYVKAGELTRVHEAYKCKVRKPWYRVPLLAPPDLFLTYMNADTARLTTNEVGAHHLNSVHGVYLNADRRDLGRELLPLASLNSVTLLNVEMIGRSYGGGVLKLEPREADGWAMPSLTLIEAHAAALRKVKSAVARKLQAGRLMEAVQLVDEILLIDNGLVSSTELSSVRAAHQAMQLRRTTRGKSGR